MERSFLAWKWFTQRQQVDHKEELHSPMSNSQALSMQVIEMEPGLQTSQPGSTVKHKYLFKQNFQHRPFATRNKKLRTGLLASLLGARTLLGTVFEARNGLCIAPLVQPLFLVVRPGAPLVASLFFLEMECACSNLDSWKS